jgi:hypothetical protein
MLRQLVELDSVCERSTFPVYHTVYWSIMKFVNYLTDVPTRQEVKTNAFWVFRQRGGLTSWIFICKLVLCFCRVYQHPHVKAVWNLQSCPHSCVPGHVISSLPLLHCFIAQHVSNGCHVIMSLACCFMFNPWCGGQLSTVLQEYYHYRP